MVAENAVRAFWPLMSVVFLILAPLMFGWQDFLPLEAFWIVVVVATTGLIATATYGLRRFHMPGRAQAVARVDAAIPGRPIAAMADAQAIGRGDPASEAVWRAHLARMQVRSRDARAVEPDLRISDRDPYGLRFIALLFFVAALMFGSVWRIGSVGDQISGGGQVLAVGPVWEGWVTPPAYTGKPALYLNDIPQGLLLVPEGSQVTLRLYGEVGALTVAETISGAHRGFGRRIAEPADIYCPDHWHADHCRREWCGVGCAGGGRCTTAGGIDRPCRGRCDGRDVATVFGL